MEIYEEKITWIDNTHKKFETRMILKLSVNFQANELPTADNGGEVRKGLYNPSKIVFLGPSKFKPLKKKLTFAVSDTISSRKGGSVFEVL